MKTLLLSVFTIFTISITAHAQKMEGTYTNTWKSDAGGSLTYTLTLNPDNTFEFVSHRVYESSHPANFTTVIGTWENKNRLLILDTEIYSDEIGLVKGLNQNKAKFKTYSPRHRNYGKIKPSLKFYKSKVFYAKGMKLFKEENDTVAVGS